MTAPPLSAPGRMSTCHFCAMPATGETMRSKCGTAVAHFECWYDVSPFHPEDRDPVTGELPQIPLPMQKLP